MPQRGRSWRPAAAPAPTAQADGDGSRVAALRLARAGLLPGDGASDAAVGSSRRAALAGASVGAAVPDGVAAGRGAGDGGAPRPEGQRADVGNLSASGLLSEVQEAMLEWSAVRAEWWYARPPALDLPQARLEWDVYTLRASVPGAGALRRRVHVVLTMATIV